VTQFCVAAIGSVVDEESVSRELEIVINSIRMKLPGFLLLLHFYSIQNDFISHALFYSDLEKRSSTLIVLSFNLFKTILLEKI